MFLNFFVNLAAAFFALFQEIRFQVDYYAVTLLDKFNVYKKSMEVLTLQVSKLSDITAELEGMKVPL